MLPNDSKYRNCDSLIFHCLSWDVIGEIHPAYFSLIIYSFLSCIKTMVIDNLKVWVWVPTLCCLFYTGLKTNPQALTTRQESLSVPHNVCSDPSLGRYWPLSFSFLFLRSRFQIHHGSTQFEKWLLDDNDRLSCSIHFEMKNQGSVWKGEELRWQRQGDNSVKCLLGEHGDQVLFSGTTYKTVSDIAMQLYFQCRGDGGRELLSV